MFAYANGPTSIKFIRIFDLLLEQYHDVCDDRVKEALHGAAIHKSGADR